MKTLIITLATIGTLILITSNLYLSSCSCGFDKSFIDGSAKTKVIALVKIDKYATYLNLAKTHPGSMEVEIIKIFKGQEDRKIVRVFGDNGNLCRPYISKFKPGETWVLGLFEGSEHKYFSQKEETKDDYFLWACDNLWLQVDSHKVTGYITHIDKTKSKETMTIDEFAELFNQVDIEKIKK